ECHPINVEDARFIAGVVQVLAARVDRRGPRVTTCDHDGLGIATLQVHLVDVSPSSARETKVEGCSVGMPGRLRDLRAVGVECQRARLVLRNIEEIQVGGAIGLPDEGNAFAVGRNSGRSGPGIRREASLFLRFQIEPVQVSVPKALRRILRASVDDRLARWMPGQRAPDSGPYSMLIPQAARVSRRLHPEP